MLTFLLLKECQGYCALLLANQPNNGGHLFALQMVMLEPPDFMIEPLVPTEDGDFVVKIVFLASAGQTTNKTTNQLIDVNKIF